MTHTPLLFSLLAALPDRQEAGRCGVILARTLLISETETPAYVICSEPMWLLLMLQSCRLGLQPLVQTQD